MKFKVIVSIDYEIHGNGDGCPNELMVKPIDRMIRLFDQFGAKVTIMADVAEILKFKEYKTLYSVDRYSYDKIIHQLRQSISSGHDVQLHLHSGYFNSEFAENKIKQDWLEYDLTNLSYEKIHERIKLSKEFLEYQLRAVKPGYRCHVFRAANWSMVPTENIFRALVNNCIDIDTSVFKWGKSCDRVFFDYTNAPDKLIPWLVDETAICKKQLNSELLEVPIYTEYKMFFSFITYSRIRRMIHTCFHKHPAVTQEEKNRIRKHKEKEATSIANLKLNKLIRFIHLFTKKHAWKFDINHSSRNQMIKAFNRIEKEYGDFRVDLPIVLTGHSKSFFKRNEKKLKKVLKYIKSNPDLYKFSTFDEISISDFTQY